MKLVFTIDRDISPERLEEYKKALNDLIGYDGEWEIVTEAVDCDRSPVRPDPHQS